jgi:hypothetical protein
MEGKGQANKCKQLYINVYTGCRYSIADNRGLLNCLAGDSHVGLCSMKICPLKHRK